MSNDNSDFFCVEGWFLSVSFWIVNAQMNAFHIHIGNGQNLRPLVGMNLKFNVFSDNSSLSLLFPSFVPTVPIVIIDMLLWKSFSFVHTLFVQEWVENGF